MLNPADRKFLQDMIEHHQMALEMSQTVIDKGTDPQVDALARRIIDAQKAEIALMERMLGAAMGTGMPSRRPM